MSGELLLLLFNRPGLTFPERLGQFNLTDNRVAPVKRYETICRRPGAKIYAFSGVEQFSNESKRATVIRM